MQFILDERHAIDLTSLKLVRTVTNSVGITGRTRSDKRFNAYNLGDDRYHIIGLGFENIFVSELIEFNRTGKFPLYTAQAEAVLQLWFSRQTEVPDFKDIEPDVSDIRYVICDQHGRLFVECIVNDFAPLFYELNRDTYDIIGLHGGVNVEEVMREKVIFSCIESCIRDFIKENPFKEL